MRVMSRATFATAVVAGALTSCSLSGRTVPLGSKPVTVNARRLAVVAPALSFDGVTVVDVEHGTLHRKQRVLIVGNRIEAVGRIGAVAVPKGAQVVDARGKYLIPGLWDLHTHAARSTEVFYPLFLANGVTGIRDAGSPVPLDTLIGWRREILAGARIGPPRQVLSGNSITDSATNCDRRYWHKGDDYLQTCVADSTDARRVVDSLRAAGADMIKLRALTPALYFVMAAEARRVGIPFGGHAGFVDEVNQWPQGPATDAEASDSGARIIDHGYGNITKQCLGPGATVETCRPLAERFRRNGTWVVLDYFYPVPTTDQFGYLERMRAFWADSAAPGKWLTMDSTSPINAMDIARRAGLPVVAGTDVMGKTLHSEWLSVHMGVPGFQLHGLLARYVADGLTPLAALQAATFNPAQLLHATDSLGTVAPGKLADLVLLDADPLADITNTTAIRAVVADGRYFDRSTLDRVLAAARAKAKQEFSPP